MSRGLPHWAYSLEIGKGRKENRNVHGKHVLIIFKLSCRREIWTGMVICIRVTSNSLFDGPGQFSMSLFNLPMQRQSRMYGAWNSLRGKDGAKCDPYVTVKPPPGRVFCWRT